MSSAKSLSDEQISTIQSWADQGDSLSDIQKKLGEELEVRVTYLETRFLLEDLKIELKPEPKPEPEPEPEPVEQEIDEPESGSPKEAVAEEEPPMPEDPAPLGEPSPDDEETLSVTIDQVVRPGAIVSGRVIFAGNKGAGWWLDQMGRLGMDTDDADFKPTEGELMAFQRELQKAIQESGL